MRCIHLLALLLPLALVACGDSSTSSSAPAGGTAPANARPPAGDPAKLPKVVADRAKIAAMLRERFGEAIARNIRIEVEDQAGGKRVGLSGEVPNEEIRQAVMKEVEVRVEGMRTQDFTMEVAGSVRMLFAFDAHVRPGDVVAFSPDISLTVSQQGDVYENATGRRINRMALGEDRDIWSAAISPDGKLLATGFHGGGITLFDLPTGHTHRVLQPSATRDNSQRIVALAFTSDGKQLAALNDERGEITLWDLGKNTAKTIGVYEPTRTGGSTGYVMAMSPDDRTIATCGESDSAVRLWDVAARKQKETLTDQRVSQAALAFSHDGKLLAAARGVGDVRGVVLFDLKTKKGRVLALDQDRMVSSMVFSPDDTTLAVAYLDEGVVLWEVAGGKRWMTLEPKKTGAGRAMAFSPDGSVLIAPFDDGPVEQIRLWDVSERPGARRVAAVLPKSFPSAPTGDDLLAAEIGRAIRGTFDRSNIEALKVEIGADGTVHLTGKVSDNEVKRVAGREAEVHHASEDVGMHELNKVVNDLEVTGRHVR